MDYYKVLNLKNGASIKEIEQAYKDLSTFYNPENNSSLLAYKKYREINRAYQILKEEKQRELYNLSLNRVVNKTSKDNKGKSISFYEFKVKDIEKEKEDISNFKDVGVEVRDDYSYYKLDLPYLYYLLKSEYVFTYNKKVIVKQEGTCPSCLGIGKVRKDEKITVCSECLGSGKQVVKQDKKEVVNVVIDNNIIVDDLHKLRLEFNFYDAKEYSVKDNVIYYKHEVSLNEYQEGIKWLFKVDGNELLIEENEFKDKIKRYEFLDKVIEIEYILTSYKGKDKKGYIVSLSDVVYLNPKTFEYSEVETKEYNYRLNLKDKNLIINDLGQKGYDSSNGNLLIEVIERKNSSYNQVFFDREIMKVSASLFVFKGKYNNHVFIKNGNFDYDDHYLYLASKAYKLKLKEYFSFQILFILLYLLFPFISFFIFGFTVTFFVINFIYLLVYLVIVNCLMEVKI